MSGSATPMEPALCSGAGAAPGPPLPSPQRLNGCPRRGRASMRSRCGEAAMSAMASLTALGASTADGVSVGVQAVEAGGIPGAGRVLPTRTELAAVLPWPGLRRGSTVAVHGSVSLLFALLSEATA